MTPNEFAFLRAFLKKRSGVAFGDEKLYLVEARLRPLMHLFQMQTYAQLIGALGQPGREALSQKVVEAMTVNETFFFRDSQPFQQLAEIMLPSLTAPPARPRPIRIWSAACSTGQEPYSIAMMLKEQGTKFDPFTFDIVATDLSSDALEKARSGCYSQFDVQRGMPIKLLMKYFTQIGNEWRVNADIRARVSFRPYNLIENPMRLGSFDIVFCRNVLIYFDMETKQQIVDSISRQIRPGGFLVVGGSESLLGVTTALSSVNGARSLYTPAPVALHSSMARPAVA